MTLSQMEEQARMLALQDPQCEEFKDIDDILILLENAYGAFYSKNSGSYGDRANISIIQEEIKRRCK